MEKDKELIDEIVNRLKEQKELPYKEGAWEKFRAQDNATTKSPIINLNRWLSVAAACLLLGLGVLFYKNSMIEEVKMNSESSTLANTNNGVDIKTSETTIKKDQNTAEENSENNEEALTSPLIANTQSNENNKVILEGLNHITSVSYNVEINAVSSIKELTPRNEFQLANLGSIDQKQLKLKEISNLKNITLANTSTNNSVLAFKEVELKEQQKSFSLSDKFDLGLFVSPHSTSEKMYVGGGLSLAYNLNKKLSVRTGASYNTYEVGIVKNPTEAASAEVVMATANTYSLGTLSYSNTSLYQERMILPNINAISGSVQSIDIPLELKYNVNNSFYAAAGISYSAIINQERNAQYIENINTETFRNGFPENASKASEVVQPVTKTVKSTEKNVNTDGYNGFVNFSIGKKVNLNKKVGLSVEPYFKLPVGEYRRADMNYTNGGIRIMTNF